MQRMLSLNQTGKDDEELFALQYRLNEFVLNSFIFRRASETRVQLGGSSD